MSLFRKKKWDIERSEQNKGLIRQLFNQAMPDGDTWKIVYGYGLNIKTSDYIIARKTTYTYTSLIIGYRESDMSIALLQTTPELEGCSEAEIFTRDSIKKQRSQQACIRFIIRAVSWQAIPNLPPCRKMTRIIWPICINRKSTRILLSSTNGFRENRADL